MSGTILSATAKCSEVFEGLACLKIPLQRHVQYPEGASEQASAWLPGCARLSARREAAPPGQQGSGQSGCQGARQGRGGGRAEGSCKAGCQEEARTGGRGKSPHGPVPGVHPPPKEEALVHLQKVNLISGIEMSCCSAVRLSGRLQHEDRMKEHEVPPQEAELPLALQLYMPSSMHLLDCAECLCTHGTKRMALWL